MNKFLIFVLVFIACSGNQVVEESPPTLVEIIPIGCSGNGDGCENLYKENANIGYIDYEKKYCNISTIDFNFEDEYLLDFVVFQNFEDDKFEKSARPKDVTFFGAKDDSMTYGGHIARATISDNKEEFWMEIPDTWVGTSSVRLEIQNGYFTPTSVDYCGLQNLTFYGYEVNN